MTKYLAGLIVSGAIVASPVAAATQVAAPKSTEVGKTTSQWDTSGKAVAAAEKKICKQLPSSNSRLPNRVCLTAKEWKQVENEVDH
jgi:hypothetical protein